MAVGSPGGKQCSDCRTVNPQNRDCAHGCELGSLRSSNHRAEESPAPHQLKNSSANHLANMPYRHQRRADSEDDKSDDRIQCFVPSDGIEFDVIAADIKCYLGLDASVEQVWSSRKNIYGYCIRSSTVMTFAMLLDLRRDTFEWAFEQKSDPRLSYLASRTYCRRHQCHPRNCNALEAVIMAHNHKFMPVMDLEKSAHTDQFLPFIQDTESRVFERGSLPPVGFRRRHFGRTSNQASMREPGTLCASSGRISLVTLGDVHEYLTEIDHVVGQDKSKTSEVYLEYGRLKSLVRALERLCKQETTHDVIFIIENTHNWDRDDYSLEGAQRLLDCIGISDSYRCRLNRANQKGHEESAPYFKDDISQLRQALMGKATDAQLILVYHSIEGSVIEEALSECLCGKDETWVQSRVACILSVDTIHAPESQTRCSCRPSITEEGDFCPTHRTWEQSRASRNLPGCLKSIRLHRVFGDTSISSSKLVRRTQTSFQRTPTYLATRRNFPEIWCGMEDFVDCFLWSVLQAMDGGQLHHRKPFIGQPSPSGACPGGPDPGPLDSLTKLLRSKESAKASMILRALRWVVFSGRPLSIDELVAAVVTSTNLDPSGQPCSFPQSAIVSTETAELLESCTSFLEVAEDGFMVISDTSLRNYVLSPATSILNPCREAEIHEMIAMACLRHLQCLHSEALFRPWLGTRNWLNGEINPCRLRSYSTKFWHEHFRRAESHSRRLGALLDESIRSALDYDSEDTPQSVKSDRRVNYGLWLCSLYDLSSAGRIYLQMNPNMESQHACGERLLHITAANGCSNMLKLLLGKGATAGHRIKDTTKAVPDSSVSMSSDAVTALCVHGVSELLPGKTTINASSFGCREEVTPLQLAAHHGHISAVNILLQADSKYKDAKAGSLSTALHLAARAGHEEIVRSLLHYGADPEARNAAGETALEIAVEERHTSVVNLLIEQNVKIKPQDLPQSVFVGEAHRELGQVEHGNQPCVSDVRNGSLGHHSRSSTTQTCPKLPLNICKFEAQNGDEQARISDCEEWCIIFQPDVKMDLE